MLRTILICTVVFASAACTSTPSHAPATASAKDAARVNCIRDTGTRIPGKPSQCLDVPGRSYSQTDIDRTGQTDAASALRQLDPSVTIHH